MDDGGISETNFQRLICDCADELRDYWLNRQSAQAVREIMSLSLSQQRMMRKVWRMNTEHPDGVMLKELAENLSLSCSAVSVMVDAMVKRGILIREAAQDDRRKVMIRISDNGMGKIREYDDFLNKFVAELFTAVNPDEANGFTAVLEKFVKHLQMFFSK